MKAWRNGKADDFGVAVGLTFDQFDGGVHVALDVVPAHAVAVGQRAFEVDRAVDGELAEVGQAQGSRELPRLILSLAAT